MKRLSIIALLCFCVLLSTSAQGEMQALRYSQYNPFGTARFAAQGGAIGALGGDFSSVLVNPAGLAFYRSSEMTLSPAFYWVNTSSQFMGRSTDDSQLRFTVGNIGLVQATTSDSKSGIVSASYAVGYNTLVNFNNNTLTYGTNTNSSLLDDFTWHANADPNNLNSYYEQLAFDAFLMPFDSTAGEYWHDMQLDGYGQEVNRSSEQSGYIGEYSLSGALNISNLIYMGASFGIHSLRFYEDIYHIETDMDDHVLDFNSFRFREYNSTEGWGYTFRMGMIVRPVQMIRVGASFQLPTYYSLTDQKVTDIKSYWDNGSGIPETSETSPNGIYDYKLRTPFRVNAHASLILLKMATISAAYEFVDYSSSKLDTYDYKFFEENDRIRQDFQAAHNVKMGAEVRTGSLYFRGGAQYLRSPFVDERNNAESWILGGGIGVRSKSVYLDMSYTHAGRTDVYGMYAFEPGSNEVAINETNSNNLMLTVGVKF